MTFTNPAGQPLVGGKVFTFIGGTTSPQNTWTTAAASVLNPNPIILNSAGQFPQEVWLSFGALYKFTITDSAGNTLQVLDNISALNDQTGFSEWIAQGVPTYLSATSFSVVGNQTAVFDVGRRVKSINTAGTIYSSVSASSYSGITNTTTVTVVNDSGSLDSGLSAVYVGLLDPAANSIGTPLTFGPGAVTFSGGINASNMPGRNRIINGDPRVDQRNLGASAAVNNTALYTIDRWLSQCQMGAGTGAINVQRITNAATAMGNPYALAYSVATAKASPSGTDLSCMVQYIEGFNIADLEWGTASAKSVTVSFTFQTSIANAVLPIAIVNNASNRSYVTSITTGAASTPTRYSVTIPGDTTGTWAIDNTIGIRLYFVFAAGATFQAGAANTWTAGQFFTIAGATNFMSSVSNTWQVTDVQFEAGTVATPMERLGFDQQLARCQRYLPAFNSTNTFGIIGLGASSSAAAATAIVTFPVLTRVSPSGITISNVNHFTAYDIISGAHVTTGLTFNSSSVTGGVLNVTVAAGLTGGGSVTLLVFTNASGQLLFTGCEL
jgi:hypothetical protein